MLFTDNGTCRKCGLCVPDYASDYADIVPFHARMQSLVVYNPRFYFKERLNNWRGMCPDIPNDCLTEIVCGVLRGAAPDQGSLPSSVDAGRIRRTLIYSVVNRLWGLSPETRRRLVYRERWLWIKRWICFNANTFGVEIRHRLDWLVRFNYFLPNSDLIHKLECMVRVLEMPFRELLYSVKRTALRRHNRVCRDIIILFCLYKLHPGLAVIYGTDYWTPPITAKSRANNVERIRVLLRAARERRPDFQWPDDSVTLDQVLQADGVEVNMAQMDYETARLFPVAMHNLHTTVILYRQQCRLEWGDEFEQGDSSSEA